MPSASLAPPVRSGGESRLAGASVKGVDGAPIPVQNPHHPNPRIEIGLDLGIHLPVSDPLTGLAGVGKVDLLGEDWPPLPRQNPHIQSVAVHGIRYVNLFEGPGQDKTDLQAMKNSMLDQVGREYARGKEVMAEKRIRSENNRFTRELDQERMGGSVRLRDLPGGTRDRRLLGGGGIAGNSKGESVPINFS